MHIYICAHIGEFASVLVKTIGGCLSSILTKTHIHIHIHSYVSKEKQTNSKRAKQQLRLGDMVKEISAAYCKEEEELIASKSCLLK